MADSCSSVLTFTSCQLQACNRELIWITRAAIVVAGVLSTVIAINVISIYELFQLCSDVVYVILFPQFVCVIYLDKANTYGAAVGYVMGVILRISGGETIINLPPFIDYTVIVDDHKMLLPFRTIGMAVCLFSIVAVSLATDFCFRRKIIRQKYDFFKCFDLGENSEELKASKMEVPCLPVST